MLNWKNTKIRILKGDKIICTTVQPIDYKIYHLKFCLRIVHEHPKGFGDNRCFILEVSDVPNLLF